MVPWDAVHVAKAHVAKAVACWVVDRAAVVVACHEVTRMAFQGGDLVADQGGAFAS